MPPKVLKVVMGNDGGLAQDCQLAKGPPEVLLFQHNGLHHPDLPLISEGESLKADAQSALG